MNIAYIKHGEWGGPYLTNMADGVAVDGYCRPNPYVMGYGAKVPTCYRILYQGAWRRVYIALYGNIGSAYVTIRGIDTIIDLHLDNGVMI
jgi:hypothetical protein